MRKARIVMISPLPELTRLTRQISRDQNFELEIVEAFLDKGVEVGKRFEQSGVDVIISRGPTGVLHREKDREKAEFLKTIIDHTYTSVIAVNKNDEVNHFNSSAEEVFKISNRDIIGKKAENLPIPLPKIFFQDFAEGKGEVHWVGGKQILFHRIPIYLDREIHGMVITFQSVHKIQNLEATIRKKLHDSGLVSHYTFNHLIGSSTEMTKTVTCAKKFASSDSTVLILGETIFLDEISEFSPQCIESASFPAAAAQERYSTPDRTFLPQV